MTKQKKSQLGPVFLSSSRCHHVVARFCPGTEPGTTTTWFENKLHVGKYSCHKPQNECTEGECTKKRKWKLLIAVREYVCLLQTEAHPKAKTQRL
jgi:hypothetical protein